MADNINNKKKTLVSDLINKIKMTDAGEKPSNNSCCDVPCCKPSNLPYYPSLYLDIEQAPDLKGYDVGETVYLLIEANITSHSLRENPDMSKESFDLKIKKIGCSPKDETK